LIGKDVSGNNESTVNFVEAKSRFQHAVKKLVQVLCSFGPLVLVMDDTHWIQQSCLNLLANLLDHQGSTQMMLVAAHRNNEVDDGHVCVRSAQQWRDLHLTFADIQLKNLQESDASSLLQCLLSVETNEVQQRAAVVHKKTVGNPFHVKEFLISLQSSDLMAHNDASCEWCYNIKELTEMADATNNVVGLLAIKLHKLDQTVQSMPPKIASLGSTFPSAVAQIVVHQGLSGSVKSRNSTEILLLLIKEGLLVECRRGWFKWEHIKL